MLFPRAGIDQSDDMKRFLWCVDLPVATVFIRFSILFAGTIILLRWPATSLQWRCESHRRASPSANNLLRVKSWPVPEGVTHMHQVILQDLFS